MLVSPSLTHNCLKSSLLLRPVNSDDGPRVASSVLGRVRQCYLVASSKEDPCIHMLIKLDGGPRATRQLRPSRRAQQAVSLPPSPLPLVPMVPRALSSPASMPLLAVSPGVAGAGPMSTPAYMPGPTRAVSTGVAGSMDASSFMGMDAPEDDFLNGLFFDDFLEPCNKKLRV